MLDLTRARLCATLYFVHSNRQSIKPRKQIRIPSVPEMRQLRKRRKRIRRDFWRSLAPYLSGAIAFLVFAGLVILTWPELRDERRFELDLAREENAEPLEEMPIEETPRETMEIETGQNEIEAAEIVPDQIPSLSELTAVNAPTVTADIPKPPAPDTVALIKSPVQLKSLAGTARGAAGRTAALKRFGGNAEVEGAVLRALRWIKRQQRPDGSWKAKGEGDATAFALLAFLSHGESFTSSEFGPTVKAAVEYLLEHHGNNMAVYALTEAAAVIRTPVLSEAAAEAVREFCLRQKDTIKANSGGIIQKYAAVMVLTSARLAKLDVPELKKVRDTYTRAFLEMRDGKAPSFKQIHGLGTWHFMVAGVCLQYLRHGEDPSTRQMLNRLDELWVPATLGKTAIACCPVRSNYFSTMIFFNAGGTLWEKWNAGMLAAYLSAQEIEGDGGFWHCQDQHIGDQPFWTTCYIAHQLMVYYRYLPTYSKEAWSPAEKTEDRAWTDPKAVVVEVDI